MSTEKFHHTLDDGREVTLPKFTNIPFGVVRRLRKESEAEQLFGLVEEVADEETLAVIDSLGMGDIEELFTAWQEEAGISAGESGASTDS